MAAPHSGFLHSPIGWEVEGLVLRARETSMCMFILKSATVCACARDGVPEAETRENLMVEKMHGQCRMYSPSAKIFSFCMSPQFSVHVVLGDTIPLTSGVGQVSRPYALILPLQLL